MVTDVCFLGFKAQSCVCVAIALPTETAPQPLLYNLKQPNHNSGPARVSKNQPVLPPLKLSFKKQKQKNLHTHTPKNTTL